MPNYIEIIASAFSILIDDLFLDFKHACIWKLQLLDLGFNTLCRGTLRSQHVLIVDWTRQEDKNENVQRMNDGKMKINWFSYQFLSPNNSTRFGHYLIGV